MMEWVEATKFALKSSIRSELITNSMMKSSCYTSLPPQLNVDDFLCLAGVNGVLPSEDFSVDEFFDLPACENDDGRNSKDGSSDVVGEEENEEDNQVDEDGTFANSSCEPLSAAELAVPADDMKELELWSHLMDDSVTESYSSYPNVSFPMETTGFQKPEVDSQPEPFHSKVSLIPPGFPAKPRSKRPRTITGRAWSYGSSPKSESDSSSNSSSSPKSVLLLNNPFVRGMELFGKPPTVKKAKKRAATETSGSQSAAVVQQRRCSHCLVTKTPQWRAGPTGPKTLCNACGVRFKSGRLYPEYRPACSPTFSSEVHSNSHRKVLEMRKKKEMVEPENNESSPIVDAAAASCVLKKSGGPDEVAD